MGGIRGWVFLAEDLGLEFHGLGFAPTGLGPFFTKHSQGDALGFRMAPRWGLGRVQVSAIGGSVFFLGLCGGLA